MNRTVITIDGHAGSGKTSLSRLLARELRFCHFSSGLLYRGLGMLAIRSSTDLRNERGLIELLGNHVIQIRADSERKSVLYLDGEEQREQDVQIPSVSEAASIVSESPNVRKALIPFQREVFPSMDIVAEGRDMGTVIFPDAPLKLFVETDIETRVKRRLAQLAAASEGGARQIASADEIAREIHERDRRDSERACAPTRAADDAIVVDNSHRSLDETLSLVLREVRIRIPGLACDKT